MRRLTIGLWLAVPAVALADVVTIAPLVDAQAQTTDGVVWTVDTGSETLNAARFASSSLERRGILEFNLSSIPAGMTIQSVEFLYEIAQLTFPPLPTIEFHGYVGNGAASPADATVPFNLLGQEQIPGLTMFQTPFDPAYVQARRDAGELLGIMTYQGVLGRQAAFWSSEGFGEPPSLRVTFVPEPAAAAALLLGLSGARRRLGRV